jgi:hypothetical protein
VINGRYLSSPAITERHERTFQVVEQLAAEIRGGSGPAR